MVGFFFSDHPGLEESSTDFNDANYFAEAINHDAPQQHIDNDAHYHQDGSHDILPPIDEILDQDIGHIDDYQAPNLEAQDISFSPNSATSESLGIPDNNQSMGDLADAIAEDSSIFSPISPNDSFDHVSEVSEESPVIVNNENSYPNSQASDQ